MTVHCQRERREKGGVMINDYDKNLQGTGPGVLKLGLVETVEN